jgi:hypothetical protein
MSVQELTGQKKTARIDKRTYESMPLLLKELARRSGIDETEVINSLLVYALVKKGIITGEIEKKDKTFKGEIEDMPLYLTDL